jgi:hypothetical protein
VWYEERSDAPTLPTPNPNLSRSTTMIPETSSPNIPYKTKEASAKSNRTTSPGRRRTTTYSTDAITRREALLVSEAFLCPSQTCFACFRKGFALGSDVKAGDRVNEEEEEEALAWREKYAMVAKQEEKGEEEEDEGS